MKMPSKNSVVLYTVGCRLNQAETRTLHNLFEENGFRVVRSAGDADIAVINTCTVTENSDIDTCKMVRRIARVNPSLRIALTGCQAELQSGHLAFLPNVSWVVGNERKLDLPALVRDLPPEKTTHVIKDPLSDKNFAIPSSAKSLHHTRANLKIQDGCDSFCSYCAVPYARGRARSRDFTDILREAECLAAAGHQEVVLTGINIGRFHDRGKDVTDVVAGLEKIEPIKRIRISSIELNTIPEGLVARMSGSPKLCRHLHIPMQSADNDILKLMNRKYTFEEFAAFAAKTVKTVPDICIGTDIITGFPGETEERFADAYQKLKDAPVHYFHVFSYSERPSAKSRALPQKADARTIAERSRKLRRLGQVKRRAFYERFLGTVQEVLCEQKKNGVWHGLTGNFLHVRIPSDHDIKNRFVTAKMIKVDKQEIEAELKHLRHDR